MKFLIKLTLITFIFLKTTNAQVKLSSRADFKVMSTVNEELPDSIVVQYLKGTSLGRDIEYIISKKQNLGGFDFSIPTTQPITMFNITFCYGKSVRRSIYYYAEPFDKILIDFKKGKESKSVELSFSGKGNEKYNVRNILYTMHTDLYKKIGIDYEKEFGWPVKSKGKIESSDYYKTATFKDFLEKVFSVCIEGNNRIQDTLTKYQKQIGGELSAFYNYEFSDYGCFRWQINALFVRSKFIDTKNALSNFYFSKINYLRMDAPNNLNLIKYGYQYKMERIQEVSDELYFKSLGKPYPFLAQYENIKSIKNSDLRDVLLTTVLTTKRFSGNALNSEGSDSLINDALNLVNSIELKRSLIEQMKFSRGSNVFNFSFPDTSGKTVGLKDLKGKVFLIDFFGSGCAFCAIFAQKFRSEIYPEFKNNPDFKFVSVNIDTRMDHWLSNLKKGVYAKYSQIDAIELNLGVQWDINPMMKYYNVIGVPFIMLVDGNGKLIARISAQRSEEISEMIRNALRNRNLEVYGSK